MSSSSGVSLIVPVYNASPYLREAIDSAMNQTAKPRQIIIVDDGSTDDSLEIARDYGSALTVIAQANAGTAAARNRGLAEADQPIVAFLDNDDRFLPRKLERQLESLSQNHDAMLCVCRVRAFWSPELAGIDRPAVDLTPQFRQGQPGSWLARRELFDQVGIFNAEPRCSFIEGSELFARIENAGRPVARIDDTLLERRLHASNKTNDFKSHMDGIMALMHRRLQFRRQSA